MKMSAKCNVRYFIHQPDAFKKVSLKIITIATQLQSWVVLLSVGFAMMI